MRIGIITLPLATNYGGILQAFALQHILQSKGHVVDILKDTHPWYILPLVYIKRLYTKYIQGKSHQLIFGEDRTQVHTKRFIKQYINYRSICSWNHRLAECYDAFIVGSDQIWRPTYYPHLERSYLSFAAKTRAKRISFAASFGTNLNEYTTFQQKYCAIQLSGFQAISVRESSAVQICAERFGVHAIQVIDPTLLLTAEIYQQLFEDACTPPSPGNLMVYVLDRTDSIDKCIKNIATTKKLIPFYVNSRVEDETADIADRIQPPVESWLRGFYDAEFIITDSFHACVFAIIFQKPFICIGNQQRGMTRFESLLSLFGIHDRLVDIENFSIYNEPSQIKWNLVRDTLARQREIAHKFLDSVLN